jgi:hypothetical protein
MKAKEKAEELIQTFWTQVRDYRLQDPSMSKTQAIQSAFIAVEFILESYPHTFDLKEEKTSDGFNISSIVNIRANVSFWEEVKVIIENKKYESNKRGT